MRQLLPRALLAWAMVAAGQATVVVRAQSLLVPAVATGTLSVTVQPAARVYVDGQLVGTSATLTVSLSQGPHRVRIQHAEYQDLQRLVRIAAGQTTRLVVSLADKALLRGRVPAGRDPAPSPVTAAITDPAIAQAIPWFKEGDFINAAESLLTAAQNLEGVTRSMGQRARAYLYLGASLIELEHFADARTALAMAQRLDRTLAPSPQEFSAQVRRAWEDAKAVASVPELRYLPWQSSGGAAPVASVGNASSPAEPSRSTASAIPAHAPATPPTSTNGGAAASTGAVRATATVPDTSAPAGSEASPAASPLADSPAAATPADSSADFITDGPTAVTFSMVQALAGGSCAGSVEIERERRVVNWSATDGSCSPSFSAPFDEVRSPAAAPKGGILLQFRSDRPSMTLMPAPDADLLAPDLAPLSAMDLPPETRVNMRRVHKKMMQALGRPYSDSLFGLLVDVPLSAMLETPSDYEGGSVRTRGTLEMTSTRGPYSLTDEGQAVQLTPVGPAVALMRNKAAEWNGKDVLISGMLTKPLQIDTRERRTSGTSTRRFMVSVSSIEPVDSLAAASNARRMTLEQVVKDAPSPNEIVRVVGLYRGDNVYGDLPNARLGSTAWVIKDEVFAIWVTGRKAAGEGFELGSSSSIDRQTWVAVTGRIEERRGTLVMRADRIELSPPPSEAAKAVTTTRIRSGAAAVRPDITFVVPIEGEEQASRDAQFLIQFTKPMDEASFRDRVRLRYLEDPTAQFPRMTVTYYSDRAFSIMVEPGAALQPGRTLECVLLPGIVDIDNQPLVQPGGAPRVLRWKIASH
jgi:hypothetical protein